MIVSVTGHRPKDFTQESAAWTRSELERVFRKLDRVPDDLSEIEHINVGMAAGTDMWAALAAFEIGIDVHAYLPFEAENQVVKWDRTTVRLYDQILAKCSNVACYGTVAGDSQKSRWSQMMHGYHARNRALVNDCDVLVAVWRGRNSGGTAHALSEACIVGRETIIINPFNRITFVANLDRLADKLEITRPALSPVG